jgi:drug/metabolite transporter (DMT)-like permease
LHEQNGEARTWLLTMVAMTACATNAVLCRMALGVHMVDAASFTAIRLASGAVTLAVLASFLRDGHILVAGSWLSGFKLFLYAVAFSFAYLSLSAGTGSLVLFGSVQATMIISGLRSGERPHVLQWSGLAIAFGGLLYLVFPGITAPSHGGSLLMAVAGVAWASILCGAAGQRTRFAKQRETSSKPCRFPSWLGRLVFKAYMPCRGAFCSRSCSDHSPRELGMSSGTPLCEVCPRPQPLRWSSSWYRFSPRSEESSSWPRSSRSDSLSHRS